MILQLFLDYFCIIFHQEIFSVLSIVFSKAAMVTGILCLYLFLQLVTPFSVLFYENIRLDPMYTAQLLEFFELETIESINVERRMFLLPEIEILRIPIQSNFDSFLSEAYRLKIKYIIGIVDLNLKDVDTKLKEKDILYIYPFQVGFKECYGNIISFGTYSKMVSSSKLYIDK